MIDDLTKEIKKEYKTRQAKKAKDFTDKYPVKTINHHHYIRKRNLGEFLQQKKELKTLNDK